MGASEPPSACAPYWGMEKQHALVIFKTYRAALLSSGASGSGNAGSQQSFYGLSIGWQRQGEHA